MQKSVFFRQVLALLLLAMLLWAVLTALLYNVLSRTVFTRIKVAEMQPRAEVIARIVSPNFLENDPYFDAILNSAFDFFDAWIFVVDGLTGDIRHSSLPDDSAIEQSDIQAEIDQNLETLMTGEYSSLWFRRKLQSSLGTQEVLFVGVPVTILFGQRKTVAGAVFFVQPLAELNAGLSSMNSALLISSLLVFALMVMPAYWATARLIRPLRQTRDVALAMAEGNFSVRANTRLRGEIGELASIMNNLSGDLAANLSALTLERNRLRQILESMSDGLIAVDLEIRITQANPVAGCLLGLDNPQMPLTDLSQLPDWQLLISAYRQSITANQDVSINLRRNGASILGQIAPLAEASGKVAGAVGLFRDITEAEHLEQTRRDYVANVSHELRTPLTAMRALIEPLKDGLVSSDSDRQRYYSIMLRETIRLSHLINDMLELSRLQAGTLPIDKVIFSLRDFLSDIVNRLSVQAEENGLELVLPVNLYRCPKVNSNPDRVEQVLIILIDNAIKYSPEGGKINLLLDWNEKQVQVSVQDRGIGIAPEDQPRVFDRFFKADQAHHQPGTGLGLAIAREILLQMGQIIRVQSQSGQGSTFTFTLDRADQAAKPAAGAGIDIEPI